MQLAPLPWSATRKEYEALARALQQGVQAGDERALAAVQRFDPRCRDPKVPWLVREAGPGELARLTFGLDEARLLVARAHDFADGSALAEFAEAVASGGPVARFEQAIECLLDGDLAGIEALLAQEPELVRARSTRRTCFDPSVHGATLLHYMAANGVEGGRQRTPPNAVAIARALLVAGAEPDALAGFYGTSCATMALLASSDVPAAAGVQGALVELLLDHGARIEGCGEKWGSPLLTALLFGCPQAVEALVRRGARTDDVAIAAGLGRAASVAELVQSAGAERRHLALALAAQLGHPEAVRVLLDAGEDPDRYNPEGAHSHATPLHHAALHGHAAVVELLLARGARIDLEDTLYHSTPSGWARHAGHEALAQRLERAHS